MTAAATLLITLGICAALLNLLVIFLQFLFHSAIGTGSMLALFEINNAAPTDFELFAMAALMAVIAMSLFKAYRSWAPALQRLRLA